MIFRNRNATPTPEPIREAVEVTTDEIKVIEKVILAGRKRLKELLGYPPYIPIDLIDELYLRAGAASVVDPTRPVVPFFHSEFAELKDSVERLEKRGFADELVLAREGRDLLNKCNALLGRARAIQNLGGTAAFVRPELERREAQ